MAVPAHDERDYEFALNLSCRLKKSLRAETLRKKLIQATESIVNSDFLNGLDKEEAIVKMIEWLEEKGKGRKKSNLPSA